MLPRVTAVIPVHNHRDWVNDAIDSILREVYPHTQVVVVDDGSTDDSAEVVLKRLEGVYKDKDGVFVGKIKGHAPLIFLLRNDQAQGPSSARNAGIEFAWHSTDIYALLDSDDCYMEGKIWESVEVFEDNPDVGVVYSDYDTLRPDGLRLRQFKEPFSRERLLQECIVNCDSLVSKRAFEACGLFEKTLRCVEDLDFWLRASEKFLLYHIPKSLVTIRVGPHSSSATLKKEVWEENYRRVFQRLQERAMGK